MRIIAGKAGSLAIEVPQKLARPTTDRVREAIFSSLGEKVVEATVLDLFAGSGALGLEALSRGASRADFVDSDNKAIEVIRRNLDSTRLGPGTLWSREVLRFLSQPSIGPFNLIFADPPYAKDEASTELLDSLLESAALPPLLAPEGLFILESFSGVSLPENSHWAVAKEKKYGKTRVSYLVPAS